MLACDPSVPSRASVPVSAPPAAVLRPAYHAYSHHTGPASILSSPAKASRPTSDRSKQSQPSRTAATTPRSAVRYRPVAGVIRRVLQDRLDVDRQTIRDRLAHETGSVAVVHSKLGGNLIDYDAVNAISSLVRHRDLSLVDTVRLVRGETLTDSRPNKALDPRLTHLLQGYEHQALIVGCAIVGFSTGWVPPAHAQRQRPPNHKSAQEHLPALLRSIRKGQDAGEYLVVALDVFDKWGVVLSPFGAVPKAGVDPSLEIRLIHDLSFPRGVSVNDATDQSTIPLIQYEHVSRIASRIEAEFARLHRSPSTSVRILMLKGDVKSAFRHLRHKATGVRWMGAALQELGIGIVDMAAPFGWTGSPAFYGVFGRAISYIVGRESPASMSPTDSDSTPFFAYEWVDDHIMVEADTGNRCAIAADVLRLAMIAVLGPEAVNETKFSQWSQQVSALGLDWDTDERTVSMPASKIKKARERVELLQAQVWTSRTQVLQVLGSLRHVCSCLRATKPFYQRLAEYACRVPVYGRRRIPDDVRLDLHWFAAILRTGRLSGLPARLFCHHPPVDVHLYMDASDFGLVVLDPRESRFIQLEFDAEERAEIRSQSGQFPINVREQLCIALACVMFGPSWQAAFGPYMPHVRCWSDNTSAVSWTNRLHSPLPVGQELNRIIGLAEAQLQFRVSAAHLAGSSNMMADAGSRGNDNRMRLIFNDLSQGWRRIPVNECTRRMYRAKFTNFNSSLWPPALVGHTIARGVNGASGAGAGSIPSSSVDGVVSTRTNWSNLLSRVGKEAEDEPEMRPQPSCPRSATSRGIISSDSAIEWVCTPATGSPCEACGADARPAKENNHSDVQLSSRSDDSSTSDRPPTALQYLRCNGIVADYIIRKADVSFETQDGRPAYSKTEAVAVAIHFRGSKTDQYGDGTVRRLQRSGDKILCPVRAAWSLSKNVAEMAAPLCSLPSGTCLSARTMAQAIKNGVRSLDLDPSMYGTHSLRSGGATALFGAGINDTAIKLLGRWQSDSFQRYTRMEKTTGDVLARAMASTR